MLIVCVNVERECSASSLAREVIGGFHRYKVLHGSRFELQIM